MPIVTTVAIPTWHETLTLTLSLIPNWMQVQVFIEHVGVVLTRSGCGSVEPILLRYDLLVTNCSHILHHPA